MNQAQRSNIDKMENPHRLFLQAFMSRGILNASEVKLLHKQCLEKYDMLYDKADLARFVVIINKALEPMQQKIEKIVHEVSSRPYYCFINEADNNITRLSTDYTVIELELFKKFVEAIILSPEGKISSIDFINLTDTIDGRITKKDAENLVKNMQCSMWIEENEGQLSLGARGISELGQYIRKQFPDHAVLCNICRKLCVQGQSCNKCDVRVHRFCASRFFKEGDKSCPNKECSEPWPHQIPVIGSPRKAAPPTPTDPITSQTYRESRKRKLRS